MRRLVHRLAGTLPLLAFVSHLAAQEPIINGADGARLDSILRAAQAEGFHGSVLVARGGTILLRQGYGLANRTSGARFTPATLVQIGSNVKDFTKVAIFQLVEAGRLSLDDSLHRWVSGLTGDKRAITLRHLLRHTAGLPLGLGGDATPVTRDEMLQRLRGLTLVSAPGATERYSNLGYALLAHVIQEVSGLAYDRYVAERILRPLGLRDTGTYLPGFDRSRVAHGHRGETDVGSILDMPHDGEGHLWALRGNGGYLSTTTDMLQFYRALRGPALLRDEGLRRRVVNFDGPDMLAGSDLVSFFAWANFPREQVELVLASNHAGFRANQLVPRLLGGLGIAVPGEGGRGGPQVVTDGGPRRPAGGSMPLLDRLPDTGAGRTIAAYIEAFNSGDTSQMRRFFEQRTIAGPQTPQIAVRLSRYLEMRENLGRITFVGIRQNPDGPGWAVEARSDREPSLTLIFDIEEAAPFRMRSLGVMVG